MAAGREARGCWHLASRLQLRVQPQVSGAHDVTGLFTASLVAEEEQDSRVAGGGPCPTSGPCSAEPCPQPGALSYPTLPPPCPHPGAQVRPSSPPATPLSAPRTPAPSSPRLHRPPFRISLTPPRPMYPPLSHHQTGPPHTHAPGLPGPWPPLQRLPGTSCQALPAPHPGHVSVLASAPVPQPANCSSLAVRAGWTPAALLLETASQLGGQEAGVQRPSQLLVPGQRPWVPVGTGHSPLPLPLLLTQPNLLEAERSWRFKSSPPGSLGLAQVHGPPGRGRPPCSGPCRLLNPPSLIPSTQHPSPRPCSSYLAPLLCPGCHLSQTPIPAVAACSRSPVRDRSFSALNPPKRQPINLRVQSTVPLWLEYPTQLCHTGFLAVPHHTKLIPSPGPLHCCSVCLFSKTSAQPRPSLPSGLC